MLKMLQVSTNLLIVLIQHLLLSLANALCTQPLIHLLHDQSGGTMVVPVGSAAKVFPLMVMVGIAPSVQPTRLPQYQCITIYSTLLLKPIFSGPKKTSTYVDLHANIHVQA